jgi:uncharacterized protein YndB with AHSA1/START domain
MKSVKIAAGVLLAAVAAMWGIGAALPVEHTASRAARYRQPPEAIWQDITNIDGFTSWRTSLTSVRRLPDENGRAAWVEVAGGDETPMRIDDASPPRRLVTRIDDPGLPFGGTWTFEIEPAEGGALLRITEEGFVRPALFRFLARFVFGHTASIEEYLTSLGAKYGETVVITN